MQTLSTLKQSKQIQQQGVNLTRQILELTRDIDRKLPLPAVFRATSTGSGSR